MEDMIKLSERIDTQSDVSEIIDLWFTGQDFRVIVCRHGSGPVLSKQFGQWDLGMHDITMEQAVALYSTSQKRFRPLPLAA